MAGVWVDLQVRSLTGRPATATKARNFRAAEVGVRVARQKVPVRTGRLRRSLKAELTSNGARFGSDVSYASYVEKGTSRMRAQPYLEPGKQAALSFLQQRQQTRRTTRAQRRAS